MQTIQIKNNEIKGMLKEVVMNLNRIQKELPSKYFYDKRGSDLFEQICSLEEYYLTDAEISIMKNNIRDISEAIGTGIELIELGSGSSTKTRLLLDHLENIETYFPVDISGEFLDESIRQLRSEYPGLQIIPIIADYTQNFQLPVESSGERKVVYFPGSTIGNFTPEKARNFLAEISEITGTNGGLLVGVDLKKDRNILEAAYNDANGITAEFNKNILIRLNRELGADFDTDHFVHKAFYNENEGRIEMHLVSLAEQEVRIDGRRFTFQKGETIHTENSYKYSLEEFENLASGLFDVTHVWTDDSNLFSVQYLQPKTNN
jgi:dimethylhistidine N-methyltransferase